MKKRIAIAVLLIICLLLGSCGKKDETSSGEAKEETGLTLATTVSEDGLYGYAVGGKTVYLHTKLEDYITDQRVFRYGDLATELGWHPMDPERWNTTTGSRWISEKDGYSVSLSFMGQSTVNQKYGYYQNYYYPTNRLDFYVYDSNFHSFLAGTVVLERAWETTEEDKDSSKLKPGVYYIHERFGFKCYFGTIVQMVYILENLPANYMNCEHLFDEYFERYNDNAFWLAYEYD